MGPIPPAEVADRAARSAFHAAYATAIDRESAREVLQARAEGAAKDMAGAPAGRAGRSSAAPAIPDAVGTILKSPVARAVGTELVRGLFGVLGVSTSRRRSRW